MMLSGAIGIGNMPPPFGKDGKKWGEQMVEYISNTVLEDNNVLRKRKIEVNENYNLYVGILDEGKLNDANNPLELEGENTTLKRSFRDDTILITPTIDTLTGEELKRKRNWKATVVNPEAVSEKEERLKQVMMTRINELLDLEKSDSDVEREVDDMADWLDYEYQDIREKRATELLNYYWEQLRLKYMFNKGFKDLLIAGESIYRIDIVGREPRVTRVNPLRLYIIMSSESTTLDDAEAIVEDMYMTPSQIIAEWGTMLTKKQVKDLYEGDLISKSAAPFGRPVTMWSSSIDREMWFRDSDEYSFYDKRYLRNVRTSQGEIRVQRVYWASLRDVIIRKYINPTTGEELEEIIDGKYSLEPDENIGETFEPIKIKEWWQGVRIGQDVFVDCKPCPIQYRSMNNPYEAYPPYVGQVYNTNDRVARSLVDMLKPLQYRWTIQMRKLDLLLARNLGKLIEIDVSKIPDFGNGAKGNLDMFYNWMKLHGVILKNPFQEGAPGQYSGQFNSTVGAQDADQTESINNVLAYLTQLKAWADELGGVNSQRRGEGYASEGLGVTQERIVRSTHQTEQYFALHEYNILKVLERLLETCKYTLELGNVKADYILGKESLELGDDGVLDADFGIKLTNSSEIMELEQKWDSLAEYAMNSGQIPYSDMIDILRTDSINEKVVKLKRAERKRREREERMSKQEQEAQAQMLQMQEKIEDKKFEQRMQELALKMELQKELEQMKIDAGAYERWMDMENDSNNNMIDDNVEIRKEEIKVKGEKELQDKQIAFEREKMNKELAVKERIEKAKARSKPKQSK